MTHTGLDIRSTACTQLPWRPGSSLQWVPWLLPVCKGFHLSVRSCCRPTSGRCWGWHPLISLGGAATSCVFAKPSHPGGSPRDEGRAFFFLLKSTEAKAWNPEGGFMQPLLCSHTSPWQWELYPSKARQPPSHQDGDWLWPWDFCPSSLTKESRESKLRGGRGTAKVILLPAGVSTWSPVRQEPFSWAAAIYLFHTWRTSAKGKCESDSAAAARDLRLQPGTRGGTATLPAHGHTVSCSHCSSPAVKVWDRFLHCW